MQLRLLSVLAVAWIVFISVGLVTYWTVALAAVVTVVAWTVTHGYVLMRRGPNPEGRSFPHAQ